MARISRSQLLSSLLCSLVLWFPFAVPAQSDTQALFSQSDLDQMLAPVALYPDDLLSDILTASTYPLEVVQADRYVKQNPNLQGNALADALNTQPWDASVKALAQFPAVLAMMDDQLSWTQELGDAFLAQPSAVMDTVQDLRAKAQATGSLQSSGEQSVTTQGNDVVIQPYSPDTEYVPYYDPNVVYGVWWWPAQPPIFWSPPQRYRPYNYGNIGAGGIVFGGAVHVASPGFNHYRPNWGSHTVTVSNPRRAGAAVPWHHDPAHRGTVAYRTMPTTNRIVQQATPQAPVVQNGVQPAVSDSRMTAQQRIALRAQIQSQGQEPAHPAPAPQVVQQHVAPPPPSPRAEAPRPATEAPHAAPAQHADASHANDAHKPN